VVIYRDVCIQNEQTQGLDGQKTQNLTADTYKILQGRGNNLEVHASDPAPARGDSTQAGKSSEKTQMEDFSSFLKKIYYAGKLPPWESA